MSPLSNWYGINYSHSWVPACTSVKSMDEVASTACRGPDKIAYVSLYVCPLWANSGHVQCTRSCPLRQVSTAVNMKTAKALGITIVRFGSIADIESK